MPFIVYSKQVGKVFTSPDQAHDYLDNHDGLLTYQVYEISSEPVPRPKPKNYQVLFKSPHDGHYTPCLSRNNEYWMTADDARQVVESYNFIGVDTYVVTRADI